MEATLMISDSKNYKFIKAWHQYDKTNEVHFYISRRKITFSCIELKCILTIKIKILNVVSYFKYASKKCKVNQFEVIQYGLINCRLIKFRLSSLKLTKI